MDLKSQGMVGGVEARVALAKDARGTSGRVMVEAVEMVARKVAVARVTRVAGAELGTPAGLVVGELGERVTEAMAAPGTEVWVQLARVMMDFGAVVARVAMTRAGEQQARGTAAVPIRAQVGWGQGNLASQGYPHRLCPTADSAASPAAPVAVLPLANPVAARAAAALGGVAGAARAPPAAGSCAGSSGARAETQHQVRQVGWG